MQEVLMAASLKHDLLAERILALFFFLGGPLSRRGLMQLLDCSARDMGQVMERFCAQGILAPTDDGHWDVRDREKLDRYVAGMDRQYCASDEILSLVLPREIQFASGNADKFLDLLRTHIRKDRAAAALICLDIATKLAACVRDREIPREKAGKYLTLVKNIQGISMMLAKHANEARHLLPMARAIAERNGDERSLLMLELVEGCHIHLSELHNTQSPYLLIEKVVPRIQEFGDSDIIFSTAAGIGLAYFVSGDYKLALENFKKSPPGFFTDRFDYLEEVGLRYLGSAACTLGRIDLGLGPMLSFIFEARRHGHINAVKWNTVHLADQLMRVGLFEQGIELLTPVIPCCDPESETKLWCWVHRALAFYHFSCGRKDVAYRIMTTTLETCIRFGLPRPYYGFTWMFDMIGAFRMAHLPDLPAYNYSHEIQAGLLSPSPLFRSAAMRVDTMVRVHEGMPWSDAEEPLRESLALAEKVGAPLDMARSQLALSRCLKHLGQEEEAGRLYAAGAATLYRYGQYDCPLPKDSPACREISSIPCKKSCLRDFQEGAADLGDHDSKEKMIGALLDVTCRALHIERGLLVQTGAGKGMQVVGSLYLSEDEIVSTIWGFLKAHDTSSLSRVMEDGVSRLLLPVSVRNSDGSRSAYVFLGQCAYLHENIMEQTDEVFLEIGRLLQRELVHIIELFNRLSLQAKNLSRRTRILESLQNPLQVQALYGPAMQKTLQIADRAAASEAPILLLGETGVGKEVLARRIHQQSGRKGPFVPIHPASFAENLFESELFGHEKGAFTGAIRQKIGVFEIAHEGTLFIDELGELSPSLQTKLLRVLQEKRFLRVGGTSPIFSNFRLVSATNRDLKEMVRLGTFREDLYYRVAVIPLLLPPLRERRDDLLMLINFFITYYARRYGIECNTISEEVRRKLCSYDWPGNIRELRSTIERAVVLVSNGTLQFDLPYIRQHRAPQPEPQQGTDALCADLPTMDELQRRYIKHVLTVTRGKIDGETGALRILGMKRSTLYRKIKEFGLDRQTQLYGTRSDDRS